MTSIESSEARCVIHVASQKDADIIVASIDPDNIIDPPMRITMQSKENQVILTIKNCTKLRTLMLTLDEIFEHLLLNQSISEMFIKIKK